MNLMRTHVKIKSVNHGCLNAVMENVFIQLGDAVCICVHTIFPVYFISDF